MVGKLEILDGRPWVCTEEQQAWLDEVRRGFELFRPRYVTAVQENRGDITLYRYEPESMTLSADIQREQELAERFIREGGIVYRDGKPWAKASPAQPKDDGTYTAQLIPLPEEP